MHDTASIGLMHRSVRWLVIALTLVVIGAVVAFWTSMPSRKIPWGEGFELRILKVSLGTNHSFSTEPFWKQLARRVLPRSQRELLGRFEGQQFQTPHDTLAVWMSEYNLRTGKPEEWAGVSDVSVMLANGVIVPGYRRPGPRKAVCWEFQFFRRDLKAIELRLLSGKSNLIFVEQPRSIFVDNPRPIRSAKWQARSLPQTNRLPHTDIVLSRVQPHFDTRSEYWAAHLRARALDGASAGWVDWRITTFDPLGNWIQGRFANRWGNLPRVPTLPTRDGATWKLLVDGLEYISNGFVPDPASGACLFLQPSPRAKQFGVQFVVLAGPGSYGLTNGVVFSSSANVPTMMQMGLPFSNPTVRANGTLTLATPTPGILCVSRLENGAAPVQARLRERIGTDDGRLFRPQKANSTVHVEGKAQWIAEFFPVRLPAMTTNLELELIATLPPVEFFVSSADLQTSAPRAP